VSRALDYFGEQEERKRQLMAAPPDGEGLPADEELWPLLEVGSHWEADGTLGADGTRHVPHRGDSTVILARDSTALTGRRECTRAPSACQQKLDWDLTQLWED
jgi:hypothetical protein